MFAVAIAVAALGLLVHARPGLMPTKRDNTITCSTPGEGTGTHCAIFKDADGFADVPTGVDSNYQCQDFNAEGKGIGQCSFHDGQSVVLECSEPDTSQLQVTFRVDKSSVSNVVGKIKWYWESEANAGEYGSVNDTYFSDDNIYIDCHSYQNTHS